MVNILNTLVNITVQGFVAAWFGRRTRSVRNGGSRIGFATVEAPLAGIVYNKEKCEIGNGLEFLRGGQGGLDGERGVECSGL